MCEVSHPPPHETGGMGVACDDLGSECLVSLSNLTSVSSSLHFDGKILALCTDTQ